MSQSIEERLETLRADLTATTLLLELLYVRVLSADRSGLRDFDQLKEHLIQDIGRVTLPGVEAVMADHTVQTLTEAATDILENIRNRLTNADMSARPSDPTP